jgi:light-regulated signal transduction histidine kinase (bacteriophytochrome)|nr:MAG TPA: HATPase [Caudoviricetes sp.]
MNLKIVSQQGELICDSLPYYECTHCILTNQSHGYANIKCQRDRENKRIAYHKNEHGELFACSRNAKTTKLFKDEVNSTVYCLKSLIALSGEVRQYTMAETSNRVNRIIHNLKSINAHAMQELYALVPQEQLIKNVRENSKIVESAIKKDVRQAALTFFRMAKFNLSIKAEFSIYEKLLQGGEKLKLEKRNHNIRDVIMIVLYMFFNDFNEKDVYIDIEEYYEKVYVDFESVQVAIYHIIENAAKYIAPKTNANITFKIEKHTQYIIFAMTSLYINQDEEFEIFNEGYSGIVAKQLKKAGKGIGMYRAKRLIELNNGTLTVEAGEAIKINGIDYANNKFIIALPIS